MARTLVEEIRTAHVERPRDSFPLYALTSILRLHEFVETRQQADEDAKLAEMHGLTADELRARTQQAIVNLIRAKPQIAIHAAQLLGWTIVPTNGMKSASVS
jgi:hypothetical protein